jgi:hypothetical protein
MVCIQSGRGIACRPAVFAARPNIVFHAKSRRSPENFSGISGLVLADPGNTRSTRSIRFVKGPKMTVSATASSAAAQIQQTARNANSTHTTASASGAAFSAVANAANQLQGIAATGGSTLSSNMLSALLGMNSPAAPSSPPAAAAPNSAGSSNVTTHHHGLGAYMEGLASTAATVLTAAAV